ncbi:MAG: hypothetical protein EBR82_52020, partial [Caulobacteraceae bacterium]|nr:hypothetical protein [Caulobacteraceae bacterium]
ARIKKLIAAQKAEIPELEKDAEYVGGCWTSEKLGYARGYVDALEEILAKIKPKKKTPQWILAVERLKNGSRE